MNLVERHATGRDYLDLVTSLLQRIRLGSAQDGVWEAAEMQWSWRRDQISGLASGYRLLSRADATTSAHHMIKRNGEHVAARLSECSLYHPSLDLFVEAPDGSVAAYGLFWPDPVTGVGLVEPMRTEDVHQNLGLARHILTAGIERLAAFGCRRMNITYMDDNPASKHIYRSVGFQPASTARTYRRSPLRQTT